MARTLEQMLEARSKESRQRINEMSDDLIIQVRLNQIRERLNISQVKMATKMGISQPSVAAIEKRGDEIKLSTMKRYVQAIGGKMKISIELPDGVDIEEVITA